MGPTAGLGILEKRDFVFFDFLQEIITKVQLRLSDKLSNFPCQSLNSKLIYTLLYMSSSSLHFSSLVAEIYCLKPSGRTVKKKFAFPPYYDFFSFYTQLI